MSKGLVGYDLAIAAMAGIEANPHHWDQTKWACATGGCLAGWAVAINKQYSIMELKRKAVDISSIGRELLFEDGERWVTIKNCSYNIFSEANTKDQLYQLLAIKYDVLEEVFRKDVKARMEADEKVKDPWA